jgi:hypothetical protein
MKRYFFDVVSGNDSAFDYNGHEFAAPEKAIEFATLMAIDLEIMHEGVRGGSTIVIRDPQGRCYFSTTAQIPELAEAEVLRPSFAGGERRTGLRFKKPLQNEENSRVN